jgi:phage-related protein
MMPAEFLDRQARREEILVPPVRVERFQTAIGTDPVADFLASLPALHRAACEEVVRFLESGEIDERPRHRAYIGDGLWELRISFGRMQYRILYTVDAGVATLLDGFQKKTQQPPKRRLDLAKKRRRELQ